MVKYKKGDRVIVDNDRVGTIVKCEQVYTAVVEFDHEYISSSLRCVDKMEVEQNRLHFI